MDDLVSLAGDPAVWVALATLIAMEVVLGIDNLLFISILTNQLPEHQRARGRRAGGWGGGGRAQPRGGRARPRQPDRQRDPDQQAARAAARQGAADRHRAGA